MENVNPFIKTLNEMPTTYLERNDKTFIYTTATIRDLLAELSGSASKLFLWIQQDIEYGKDYFKLNSSLFLKKTKMSSSTLIKAKKELIIKNIIAKVENTDKYYWINPIILFKGNRVEKYPDNLSIFKGSVDIGTSDSKIN